MKILALTPLTARRLAPLVALALQACVPALDTIENTAPRDTTEVMSELEENPAGEDEPGGGGPDAPGPGPVAPPGGGGPSADDGMTASTGSLQLQGVTPAALMDVPVDAPLRITFAEALDPASSSSFTLQLEHVGSVIPVAGEIVLEGNAIAFRPTQGLALANDYTLTLEGTVRSASGASWTGKQEASFETRDGAWIAPQRLTISGEMPRIGLDEAGNALAIWNELDAALSGAAGIGMAQFTRSGGWQVLPTASRGCGPGCVPKFVAGGRDGVYEIAWAATGSLQWQLYQRDAGFGEIFDAAARGTDDAVGVIVGDQPWIGMHLPQGITVSHQGATGNAPSAYITDSGLSRAGPVLAVDRSQNARVFWAEGNRLLQLLPGADAQPSILASWSASETIASITGSSTLDGATLLAWDTRYPATDGSLLFSSLGVLLVGSNGSMVDRREPALPEAGEGNRASPAASLNDEGDALLGWLRSDGDPRDPLAVTDVWMAHRSGVTGAWSEAVPLSADRIGTAGAGIAHPPAVGIDSSGNGHGIWVETDDAGASQLFGARLSGGAISGARFPISRDGAVQPATAVNELSGDDNTRLVVDAAGRALALWVSPTGEIWAARFE